MRTPLLAISLVFSGCFLVEDDPVNHREVVDAASAHDAARDVASDAVVVDAATSTDTREAPDAAACAAIGGTCMFGKSANCRPGTQPADGDVHRGCGESRGNLCCVPVAVSEASSCVESDAPVDCFPTAACHPCFSAVTDSWLACAGGRTCCAYTCPD